MKNLSILGSTGSIGVQTLDVVRENREQYKICAISANSNIDLLEAQIREFSPKLTALGDETRYKELKSRVGTMTEIVLGEEGIVEAAKISDADVVISAIVGIAGLKPTYNAILSGKDIALANKETLVTAGRIIMNEAKKRNVKILPVDSEHSAIFQSIGSNYFSDISKIILTASGGPFRTKSQEELLGVSLEDALKHPNWKMGRKISVDSATMMNKGLEIIEARWLFDMTLDKIEVCVHPESIIHSMVEFVDGSIIAQMGTPDMRIPIQYALTYPKRSYLGGKRVNLFDIGRLTFEKPDMVRFPCLRLAQSALAEGDSACVVLNSANEAAVQLFLEGRISFTDISRLVEKALSEHCTIQITDIEQITEIDKWSRDKVMEYKK